MLLSKIPNYLDCIKIYKINQKQKNFSFISTNSKSIKKNSVLVINNCKFKIKYIHEAINNGAIAIITNKFYKNIKITQFVVKDTGVSLKKLLEKIKKYPPNNIIGITGTNGKTSVLWNTIQILFFLKKNVKSYGTLGYYNNLKKIEDSLLTTPEYEILYQKSFSNSKNFFEFVFEVSSHSISKERIKYFPINIAALTNITQDHLDFHKTISNYKNTKFKLFLKHLKPNGIAILNDKIDNIKTLKRKLISKKHKIITYGVKNSDIFIYESNQQTKIKIFNNSYLINNNKFNKFELENLSCSIACCISIGVEIKKILKIIPLISKPKGRLEEVTSKKNELKVLIDYAHTPDALRSVLINNTYKNLKPNILFGCGGDRDKSKRKKMGMIAKKYANLIYITDDNPRKEDPSQIRKTIIKSCPKAKEIPGRKVAIKIAIQELKKNQTLIIAGKGHEKYQILKNKTIKFDDAKIANYYLNK